jgi:hypothetical protein
VISEEAAVDEETRTRRAIDAREQDSDPNRGAPPVGGEARKSPNAEPTYLERVWQIGAGPVGGYNAFWIDPGERVLRVDGQARSSIIIDPPDGRVPAYTPAARERIAKTQAARKAAGGEFDHPELRPLGERCITSFGNNAGPPMLPNYFYNNNYSIVQSKDTIVILTEMVHDARVVRIGGQHAPPGVRKWFGDSIGRWEGDTLVIETTNFSNGFQGSSPAVKLTERYTRVSHDFLHWEITVDDPETWVRPWTFMIRLKRTDDQLYEYACHEGNHSMIGILAGARAAEAKAAAGR